MNRLITPPSLAPRPDVGAWPVEREPNVKGPVTVFDASTGDPALIVARFPGDLDEYRLACQIMPMSTTYRASGIRNESQVFGYVGRRAVLKREGCRACSAAVEKPLLAQPSRPLQDDEANRQKENPQ